MKQNKRNILSLGVAFIAATVSFNTAADLIDLTHQKFSVIGTPAVSRSNVGVSGGVLYETRFNSATLQGDVIARPINADGSIPPDDFDELGRLSLNSDAWRASRVMAARDPATRILFVGELEGYDTGDSTVTADIFRWGSLSQHTKELIDPTTAADTGATESLVLNWLRGDAANEGLGAADFRSRTALWISDATYHNKIGSVVRSAPVYVPAPREFYSENNYFAFRQAYRTRTPMVYVGANDGFLHAFDATINQTNSGKEIFGFMPAAVLDKVGDHPDKDVSEQVYSVDGSPTVEDAYGPFPQCTSGSCWRTILVSGLNGGGRSIFALDVTDPVGEITAETAANAGKLFLWEHAAIDMNDDYKVEKPELGENPILGFTYSKPIIAQLNNGVWAAIYGNGYNAKEGNPFRKAAWLFVRDLVTGAEIATIKAYRNVGDFNTQEEPNGLSSVTPWDENFDGKVDYIYAGDLDGNLWKFDLSDTDPANFKVAFPDPDNVNRDRPLIQVVDSVNKAYKQPITSAPAVTVHPDGGVMVYFGTGAAIDLDQQNVFGDRSVYGIRDDKPAGDAINPPYGFYPLYTSDASKPGQKFTLTQHILGKQIPAVDAEPVLRGIKSTTASSDNVGWEIVLQDYVIPPNDAPDVNMREQLLVDITVSNQRVNFITTEERPGENNFSWMNIVDFRTGAAPSEPVFDANLDGSITATDVIDIASGPTDVVPISGALGIGVPSGPNSVTVANKSDVFMIGIGVELFGIFTSPFSDGGLAGGHFDEDEGYIPLDVYTNEAGDTVPIDWDNPPFDEALFGDVKHTHEYDDGLDINGVNLLRQVDPDADPPETDAPRAPPNVETTDGIKEGYQSLQGGINSGEFLDDQGNQILDTTVVEINVINPHSVDTLTWANERIAKGISAPGSGIAPPARVYFACSDPGYHFDPFYLPNKNHGEPRLNATGTGFDGGWSAPDFAAMAASARTCTVKNMTALMVRYNDINAMRATSPGCVKGDNNRGPVLPPPELLEADEIGPDGEPLRQNSQYRDGAFTVQASQYVGGKKKAFWENWNYEHIKDLDDPPRGDDCGEVNEDLRAYRTVPSGAEDPCAGKKGDKLVKCRNENPGSDPNQQGNTGKIQFAGEGGFLGFVGVAQLALDPYAGDTNDTVDFTTTSILSRRVNWREILSE